MRLRQITTDRKQFLPLLLLGDEQQSMLDRYLPQSDLFAGYDDDLKGVCAVLKLSDGIYELKNIAICPNARRKGYGRAMIEALFDHYRPDGRTMLAGTGDSPLTVPFYQSCGFVYSHRIPKLFIEHYDHPIIEAGRRLTDMLYFKRDFKNSRNRFCLQKKC